MISIGAGKRERGKNMVNIVKEIYELEQRHKMQAEVETHGTLIIKRDQLKDLMEQETRREFNRVTQERYKWGNKPGKHLAKIFINKKTLNYIEKIKNERGEIVNKTTDIASTFQQYYSTFYAIKDQETKQEKETRKRNTLDYLIKAKLPKIKAEQLIEL